MKTIEVVAAIIVRDGKVFATKRGYGKWQGWWEFPGGKIEAGESPEDALVREIREELGLDSTIGAFLGVVENSFLQHGKPHAEINLVYELSLAAGEARAKEDWIEFEWRPLSDLGDLLPETFRKLGADPAARFEP